MKKKIKQLQEFGRLAYPGGDPFFRRAEHIRKRLEKMEKKEKPVEKKELPLNFLMNNRSGEQVLTLRNYDLIIENNPLIKGINCNIKYKDKICLLGPNGCGKSTLIKRIIDNNDEHIKIGSNVRIGYLPQNIEFEKEVTVLEYCRSFFHDEEHYLRSFLDKFYFHGEDVFKKVTKLSGGEKVRLKLFELIHKNNNFLILDEPTNHIDIMTKEVLEDALKDFEGTILCISHDRYFINVIASKLFVIKDNSLKEYIGNYNYYKNMLK